MIAAGPLQKEVWAFAKAIARCNAEGGGRAGLVYNADPEFDTKMQAGQATFAGSSWEAALAKYLDMNKAGCFQPNGLGTSYEASQQLAATGRIPVLAMPAAIAVRCDSQMPVS